MDKESNPKSTRRRNPLAARAHVRGANLILSLLPAADRRRFAGRCEQVSLDIETVLYEAGGAIDAVYFPLSGMVSLVLSSKGGATIEVAVVGNEGVAGAAAALGAQRSHVKALIQAKGEFLRMQRKDFLAQIKANGAFASLVQRFSLALMTQISQSVLCNRAHSMEERICRWLLMTHDRAGTDQIQLTQHFIAEMLGVRRPSVTVAAGLLQKAGLISYSRGLVKVLDRAGLEDAACECYAIVTRELDALLRG
jgi:CRP-like cAMP-binding protein